MSQWDIGSWETLFRLACLRDFEPLWKLVGENSTEL